MGIEKLVLNPKRTFEVDFQLNYKNKIIGNQRNIVDFQSKNLKDVDQV